MSAVYLLAVEHDDAASFSRSVDPTATRRMKKVMAAKGWRNASLVDVAYGKYPAGVGRCTSIYRYEIGDAGAESDYDCRTSAAAIETRDKETTPA